MPTDTNLTSSGFLTNDDICKCLDTPPIVLQSTLGNNPIVCADCNLEVNVRRLNLPKEIFGEIKEWQHKFDYLYKIWLESGDQEKQTSEQLSRLDSEVNKIGLAINRKIGQLYECYYWWFVDYTDENHSKLLSCPNCSADLFKRQNKFNVNTRICNQCKIMVAD
jgi:predicted  nucleic acid-binding Zn ribbon protein